MLPQIKFVGKVGCVLLLSIVCGYSWAGPKEVAISKGTDWLINQQNQIDGSWGGGDVAYVCTTESVVALEAANRLSPAYYAGIAWIYNNYPSNVDYMARKILAIGSTGQAVQGDLDRMGRAQAFGGFKNNGWGLTGGYQGAPIDTALFLQAFLGKQQSNALIKSATDYLVNSELSSGWAISEEKALDSISTAQAIIGLIPYAKTDVTVQNAIDKGLTGLNGVVGDASSTPEVALAAIANIKNNQNSVAAVALVNTLVSRQGPEGSWGGDVYGSALAIRALAVAAVADFDAEKTNVSINDANLRALVNKALGRSALDSINRGHLVGLTSLDISNANISDLTGLEWATNLTALNASGNRILSVTPLSALKYLTQVNLSGNPVTLAATSTKLNASQNPANKAVAIDLTVTVQGKQPIGTVTIYDGMNALGSVTLNATSGSVDSTSAKFVLNTKLSGGFRKLSAVYSGDAKNSASSSPVVTEMVNPDAAALISAIMSM